MASRILPRQSIFPKDCYVYFHRRASDNAIFYVGKGTGGRAWDKNQRNPFWLSTAKKHGVIVEILQDGIQSWYAIEIECELIASIGIENLTNMTLGGEGGSTMWDAPETRKKIIESRQHVWSDEQYREKISEKRKQAWLNPEFREALLASLRGRVPSQDARRKSSEKQKGRTVSEQTRARMSQAAKGKIVSQSTREKMAENWRGKKHSPETKQKMAAARRDYWSRRRELIDNQNS